jgi:hypothetical protein
MLWPCLQSCYTNLLCILLLCCCAKPGAGAQSHVMQLTWTWQEGLALPAPSHQAPCMQLPSYMQLPACMQLPSLHETGAHCASSRLTRAL